jgi:cation transporter-like permease
MSYTVVAYTAGRLSYRFADSVVASLVAAFVLTLLGQLVYAFLGTLFGQGTLTQPGVVSKIVLPAVWNLLLAYPVFWVMRVLYAPRDRSWAA